MKQGVLLGVGLLCSLSACPVLGQETGARAFSLPLPELPPMPEVAAPREPGSVEMQDPAHFEKVSLGLPIASGPFGPSWESIAAAYPADDVAWLREAKFGFWVHFGPQSAGQSGDWYGKRLYMQKRRPEVYANHRRRFGHPSEVGYKGVLRDWNPEKLDPECLVQQYRDAGARFLFIQGVHHDNFDNWNSRYQSWNSVNLGPRRDLLREWADACRGAGMRFGITFHHEYTWWWWCTAFQSDKTGPKAGVPYDGRLTKADGKGRWWEGLDPRLLYAIDLNEYRGIDVPSGAPAGGIFQNHLEYARWYATWWAYRIMDAVEQYDPDFIYTDGNTTQPFCGVKSGTGYKCDAAESVIADYFNRTLAKRGEVDTFAIVKFAPPHRGVVNTQEGRIPAGIKTDQPWIGETAVGDWFYSPGFVYDAGAAVRYLVENAARDGATALCLPQRPDGSLDDACVRMMRRLGDWLKVNGNAIYGSKAWMKLGEGEVVDGKLRVAPGGKLGQRHADFRFTTRDFRFTVGKDGCLYAFCMAVPQPGEELTIRSLGTDAKLLEREIGGVELLGSDAAVWWEQRPEGLVIRCPGDVDCDIAAVFRIR